MKGKRRRVHHGQWRSSDFLCAGFATLGWILSTVDYELSYSVDRSVSNCLPLHEYTTLRWLTVLSTVISLGFLIQRHYYKRLWILSKSHSKSHSPLPLFHLKLAIECSILCVFPYPDLQGQVYTLEQHNIKPSYHFLQDNLCYTLSEILYFLMFLRFFFVLRAAVNSSKFMDSHARRVAKPYRVKANMRFTLRAWAQIHSFSVLIVLLLCTALLTAMVIRLFERPYVSISHQDLSYYPNSVYYTFISITTIAYGDFYARTQLGRFSVMLAGILGMGAFSIMINMIDRILRISKPQREAYLSLRRTRVAGRLIICFFRYVLTRKRAEFFLSPPVICAMLTLKAEGRRYRRQAMELSYLLDESHQHSLAVATDPTSTMGRLTDLDLKLQRIVTKVGQVHTLESRIREIASLLARLEAQT